MQRVQEASSLRLSSLFTASNYGLYDIEQGISSHDITLYVCHCLRSAHGLHHGQLDILIEKSNMSLVWAATACRYIMAVDGFDGKATRYRLEQVIMSDGTLDALYMTIMQGCDKEDEIALQILGLVAIACEESRNTVDPKKLISAVPPLYFRPGFRLLDVSHMIWRLSCLFRSIEDQLTTPTMIQPHHSFKDFLVRRSGSRTYNDYIGGVEKRVKISHWITRSGRTLSS